MNRNNLQTKIISARSALRHRFAAVAAATTAALVPAFAMAQAGPGAAVTGEMSTTRADVLAVIVLLAGILALIVAWKNIKGAAKS